MKRTPLRRVGVSESSKRLREYRAKTAAICRQRSVTCEAPGCTNRATEVDHTFGRGSIISEPMASAPELLAYLCHDCHQSKTDEKDQVMIDQIRWWALHRFTARLVQMDASLPSWSAWYEVRACMEAATIWGIVEVVPIDIARVIEGFLKSEGWMESPWDL